MVITTISLDEEDINFIKEQRKGFCLSKFIRAKLKEYRKMLEGLKDGK